MSENKEAYTPSRIFNNGIVDAECVKNELEQSCGNRGLVFGKYFELIKYYESEDDKEYSFKRRFKDINEISGMNEEQESAYKEMGYEVINIDMSFAGKSIVGLGTASAYEYGMTFHHTLGIPYIPGQAIKGVCRNYYIQAAFDGKEEAATKDSMFNRIFGYSSDEEAGMGDIIFMDAYSIGELVIVNDIMNNHYPEYYESGEVPPANYLNPRPLNFLTICKKDQEGKAIGARFRYSFAIRSEKLEKLEYVLFDMVKNAFCEIGIGAKTSVGYGQFLKADVENVIENIKNDKMKKSQKETRERIIREEGEVSFEIKELREGIKKDHAEFFNKWEKDEENNVKAALFYKEYLVSQNQWFYKKKKNNKLYARIERVCEILGEELPIK